MNRRLNLDEVTDTPLNESDISAVVNWFGQPTEIKLASRILNGAHLIIEFSPVELSVTHRFVVAQPDPTFIDSMELLEVRNQWPLPSEMWMDSALANIELGFWARAVAPGRPGDVIHGTEIQFLGALGIGWHYMLECMQDGQRRRSTITDDHSPLCDEFRWFDGSAEDAREFLAHMDDVELQAWFQQEVKREGSALEFSLNCYRVHGSARRVWLPTIERDRTEELLQVVGWVLSSDSTIAQNGVRAIEWKRPRFSIGHDDYAGQLYYPDIADTEKRLQALWPFIWEALKDYAEPSLARRIPNVGLWVEERYTLELNLKLASLSQHERIATKYLLKDWLEENAPLQREQWESLL